MNYSLYISLASLSVVFLIGLFGPREVTDRMLPTFRRLCRLIAAAMSKPREKPRTTDTTGSAL